MKKRSKLGRVLLLGSLAVLSPLAAATSADDMGPIRAHFIQHEAGLTGGGHGSWIYPDQVEGLVQAKLYDHTGRYFADLEGFLTCCYPELPGSGPPFGFLYGELYRPLEPRDVMSTQPVRARVPIGFVEGTWKPTGMGAGEIFGLMMVPKEDGEMRVCGLFEGTFRPRLGTLDEVLAPAAFGDGVSAGALTGRVPKPFPAMRPEAAFQMRWKIFYDRL